MLVGINKGGVVNYERFQFHKYCVDLAMKTDKNVVELISSKHEKQKEINCAYLHKVLESIVFLGATNERQLGIS